MNFLIEVNVVRRTYCEVQITLLFDKASLLTE